MRMFTDPTQKPDHTEGNRIADVASALRKVEISPATAPNADRMIDRSGRTITYTDKQF